MPDEQSESANSSPLTLSLSLSLFSLIILPFVMAGCHSHDRDDNGADADKAAVSIIVGTNGEAKVSFPSVAVKYMVELLGGEGAVLEQIGFAAKGSADKEFAKEYEVEGSSRVLKFATANVAARQIRVSGYDEAGTYLGSGCVTDPKLAAGEEFVFDNSEDAEHGGFDFVSAADEAENSVLEVTASETSLEIGETAELTAILRNEDTGLVEDVTAGCVFTADSDCVSLNGSTVAAESEGEAAVTATLALNDQVSLSGEVQFSVSGEGGGGRSGQATVVVVDGEKYKTSSKYIVKFVDDTCRVIQREKFAAKASGDWKAYKTNANGSRSCTCTVPATAVKCRMEFYDDKDTYIGCAMVAYESVKLANGKTYYFVCGDKSACPQVDSTMDVRELSADLNNNIIVYALAQLAPGKSLRLGAVYIGWGNYREVLDDASFTVTSGAEYASLDGDILTGKAAGNVMVQGSYALNPGDVMTGMSQIRVCGARTTFFRILEGEYLPCDTVKIAPGEYAADIAYGKLDAGGNVTVKPAVFTIWMYEGTPNGYITLDPEGTDTEICTVILDPTKKENGQSVMCDGPLGGGTISVKQTW